MTPATVTLDLTIHNCYPGDVITRRVRETVPNPGTTDAELYAWADDHLWELTGTGRSKGSAYYEVEITGCAERPDLVGRAFSWGG